MEEALDNVSEHQTLSFSHSLMAVPADISPDLFETQEESSDKILDKSLDNLIVTPQDTFDSNLIEVNNSENFSGNLEETFPISVISNAFESSEYSLNHIKQTLDHVLENGSHIVDKNCEEFSAQNIIGLNPETSHNLGEVLEETRVDGTEIIEKTSEIEGIHINKSVSENRHVLINESKTNEPDASSEASFDLQMMRKPIQEEEEEEDLAPRPPPPSRGDDLLMKYSSNNFFNKRGVEPANIDITLDHYQVAMQPTHCNGINQPTYAPNKGIRWKDGLESDLPLKDEINKSKKKTLLEMFADDFEQTVFSDQEQGTFRWQPAIGKKSANIPLPRAAFTAYKDAIYQPTSRSFCFDYSDQSAADNLMLSTKKISPVHTTPRSILRKTSHQRCNTLVGTQSSRPTSKVQARMNEQNQVATTHSEQAAEAKSLVTCQRGTISSQSNERNYLSVLPKIFYNSSVSSIYYMNLAEKQKVMISAPYKLPFQSHLSTPNTCMRSPYEIYQEFRSPSSHQRLSLVLAENSRTAKSELRSQRQSRRSTRKNMALDFAPLKRSLTDMPFNVKTNEPRTNSLVPVPTSTPIPGDGPEVLKEPETSLELVPHPPDFSLREVGEAGQVCDGQGNASSSIVVSQRQVVALNQAVTPKEAPSTADSSPDRETVDHPILRPMPPRALPCVTSVVTKKRHDKNQSRFPPKCFQRPKVNFFQQNTSSTTALLHSGNVNSINGAHYNSHLGSLLSELKNTQSIFESIKSCSPRNYFSV